MEPRGKAVHSEVRHCKCNEMMRRVVATTVAVGKQYCITYSECAFVVLSTVREMRMCRIVAVRLCNIFPHYV